MLINLNWYECNKILRLLHESHEPCTCGSGSNTTGGDEELEAKIKSHRHDIEVDKRWSLEDKVPGQGFYTSCEKEETTT